MMDIRVQTDKKIAVVAHCLLNQNAKPYLRARFPGIVTPLLEVLIEEGFALFQLPCPEVAFAGLNRFSQVIEQYDTPKYRQHCRDLSVHVLDQIEHYIKSSSTIVIIGIDGSPSCGVHLTGSSADWKGYPKRAPLGDRYPVREGMGIFIKELRKEFELRGLMFPPIFGVGLDLPEVNLETLAQTAKKKIRSLRL